jgi:hypothetical protein
MTTKLMRSRYLLIAAAITFILPSATAFAEDLVGADYALDRLRCQAFQCPDDERSANDHRGASLYLTDLVHTGVIKAGGQQAQVEQLITTLRATC